MNKNKHAIEYLRNEKKQTTVNEKIDAVIMFVDLNDIEWRNRYEEYIKNHEIPIPEINNVEVRSRDYGTLKCLIRSIEKNIPWINNVFLVVQSESQVPEWINRETVKVVLHEEFIPKEFLPTFNCNTIEMFMHKISNISEKFIYFNDDMIINKISAQEDFFKGNLCNLLSEKCIENVGKNTWYNCQLNGTRIVNRILNIDEYENVWHKFPHTITP